MALNNQGDLKNEILVRLSESTTVTTSAGITDIILGDWINDAYRWACSYKKWPMTERRDATSIGTWSSGTEEYSYPTDFKSDSVRLLIIGGITSGSGTKRIQKTAFEDYQIYRELNSTGADKIFTDYGRTIFINPQITGASGTITVWGQYLPGIMDRSDPTVTNVFSGTEEEANEAIVEESLRYAMIRRLNANQATIHHQRAIEILEGTWEKIKDEQFEYQTKDRGMWKRFDVLSGVLREELLKRDQFPLI